MMKKLNRKFSGKHITATICIAAIVLTVIAGVIGSNGSLVNNNGLDYGIGSTYSLETDQQESVGSVKGENMAGATSTESTSSNLSDVCRPTTCTTGERIITKTANMNVQTKDYETFTKELIEKIKNMDGYVQSSATYKYGDEDDNSYGNIIVKIPTEKLDKFIAYVESKASVNEKTITIDDITENYVDTESKLNNLKVEEQTLNSMLEKATSLSDMIAIEDKLSEIRSEIDYNQSMLTRMQGDVSKSTVNISISEVDRETQQGTGFIYDLRNGFIDSLYAIGRGFKVMTIWFVSAIPFIAIIVVFGILISKIVKTIKKKKDNKVESENDRSEQGGGQTDN